MPKVKCNVSRCTHNMGGSVCAAGGISVYNSSDDRSTTSAEDTQCKSFHVAEGVGDMLGALHNVNVGGMISDSLGNEDMNPSVDCTVSSCAYNGKGKVCTADAIEVSGSDAETAQDTDCKTYRKKS